MDDDARKKAIAAGTVTATSTLATEDRIERFTLAWTDERGRPRTMIVSSATTLGSSPELERPLRDAANTVSRCHAEIESRPDGLWIRDLESKNGTWIDRVRVDAARLYDGARLRLGDLEVRVSASGSAPRELWPEESFGELIGRSAVMRSMFTTLSKVAPSEEPVLVQGETGTGKEGVAKAIHNASAFRQGKLVTVDCAALTQSLAGGELFGHEKGSFTGSTGDRAGLLESAHGGTVFFDEIGELPMSLQPILLRFLETYTVRRIGESSYKKVNTRFVAATHRDLRAMINRDPPQFREDLYFRLAVVPLRIPPLRQRREDIPLLVRHFLRPSQPMFSDEIMARVVARDWPGNVRQLASFVRRASTIGAEASLEVTQEEDAYGSPSLVDAALPLDGAREKWNEQCEREYFTKLLDRFGRDANAIAESAGVGAPYVRKRLHQLGLWEPRRD